MLKYKFLGTTLSVSNSGSLVMGPRVFFFFFKFPHDADAAGGAGLENHGVSMAKCRAWRLMGVCTRHFGLIYQQKMTFSLFFSPPLNCVPFWKKLYRASGNRCFTRLDKNMKNSRSRMKWCICHNKLACEDHQVLAIPQTFHKFLHASQEPFAFPDILELSILWPPHNKIILLWSHLCCNCYKISESSEFLHLIKLGYIKKLGISFFFNQEMIFTCSFALPCSFRALLDTPGPSSTDLRNFRGWHATLVFLPPSVFSSG